MPIKVITISLSYPAWSAPFCRIRIRPDLHRPVPNPFVGTRIRPDLHLFDGSGFRLQPDLHPFVRSGSHLIRILLSDPDPAYSQSFCWIWIQPVPLPFVRSGLNLILLSSPDPAWYASFCRILIRLRLEIVCCSTAVYGTTALKWTVTCLSKYCGKMALHPLQL